MSCYIVLTSTGSSVLGGAKSKSLKFETTLSSILGFRYLIYHARDFIIPICAIIQC